MNQPTNQSLLECTSALTTVQLAPSPLPGLTQDQVLDQCARLIANGAGNPKDGPGPMLESVFVEGHENI